MDQCYQSRLLLVVSHSRSPIRSGYRELGLELVSLEGNFSCQPKRPLMAEEKRDDIARYPFKMLLEKALVRQRNEMMGNFAQILQRLPMATVEAYSIRIHFASATPFKVQVNFDIPLIEGKIDTDALEKWLNLLEGYYSVQKNSNSENITFAFLKSLPHVKYWWEGYYERYTANESTLFGREPTWATFVDALKEDFYPVENYDDQYMRWTTLRQKRDQKLSEYTNIFHTLHSKLGIKDSEWHLVLKYRNGLHRYIQT
jgi:hypothetical protein